MSEKPDPNDETAIGIPPPAEGVSGSEKPDSETLNPPPNGVPEDLWGKIVGIVSGQLGVSKPKIFTHSTLEGLGADSLDRVETTMEIEEKLLDDQKIPDSELEKLQNLGEFAQLVQSKLTSTSG